MTGDWLIAHVAPSACARLSAGYVGLPGRATQVEVIAIVLNPAPEHTIMVWCFSDAGVDL